MRLNRKSFVFIFSLLLALIVAACSSDSAGDDLIGVTWKWAELHETLPAAQSVVPDSDNYTIQFNDDGSFSAKADCNNVSGSYIVEGDSLTLQLGPATLAECGESSLHNLFVANLALVSSFSVEDDVLTLSFQDEAGRMVFGQ